MRMAQPQQVASVSSLYNNIGQVATKPTPFADSHQYSTTRRYANQPSEDIPKPPSYWDWYRLNLQVFPEISSSSSSSVMYVCMNIYKYSNITHITYTENRSLVCTRMD